MEKACAEEEDEEFSEALTSSVQDLEEIKVAQESNTECAHCDMRQGDKVGSSVSG